MLEQYKEDTFPKLTLNSIKFLTPANLEKWKDHRVDPNVVQYEVVLETTFIDVFMKFLENFEFFTNSPTDLKWDTCENKIRQIHIKSNSGGILQDSAKLVINKYQKRFQEYAINSISQTTSKYILNLIRDLNMQTQSQELTDFKHLISTNQSHLFNDFIKCVPFRIHDYFKVYSHNYSLTFSDSEICGQKQVELLKSAILSTTKSHLSKIEFGIQFKSSNNDEFVMNELMDEIGDIEMEMTENSNTQQQQLAIQFTNQEPVINQIHQPDDATNHDHQPTQDELFILTFYNHKLDKINMFENPSVSQLLMLMGVELNDDLLVFANGDLLAHTSFANPCAPNHTQSFASLNLNIGWINIGGRFHDKLQYLRGYMNMHDYDLLFIGETKYRKAENNGHVVALTDPGSNEQYGMALMIKNANLAQDVAYIDGNEYCMIVEYKSCGTMVFYRPHHDTDFSIFEQCMALAMDIHIDVYIGDFNAWLATPEDDPRARALMEIFDHHDLHLCQKTFNITFIASDSNETSGRTNIDYV
eukprot:NODE_209_length_12852_cov_0.583863.p1 type:complete len:529 gc:universal NODE_209_length_12852_cov_0.583863:10643-12229(+)